MAHIHTTQISAVALEGSVIVETPNLLYSTVEAEVMVVTPVVVLTVSLISDVIRSELYEGSSISGNREPKSRLFRNLISEKNFVVVNRRRQIICRACFELCHESHIHCL